MQQSPPQKIWKRGERITYSSLRLSAAGSYPPPLLPPPFSPPPSPFPRSLLCLRPESRWEEGGRRLSQVGLSWQHFGQRSVAPAEQRNPLSRKGWGAALGWPGPCSCTCPAPVRCPTPGWPFPVPRVRARLPVFLEILEKPWRREAGNGAPLSCPPCLLPSLSPSFFFFFLLNFIPRRPRCGGSLSPPQGRRYPARSGAHGAVFREAFACSSLPRRMLPGLFWLLFFAGDEGSALKMEMIWFLFLSLVPVYSRGQGVYGKRHCRGRGGGDGGTRTRRRRRRWDQS